MRFILRKTLLSPSRHSSPLAWRASPPALGIAYCTRLPWAPPARWGFPALSGSLALNLGSLPNAGRMSDEVSALVCPFPMMASPGLATMNESSHSQGTPAYLGSLIPPPLPSPFSLRDDPCATCQGSVLGGGGIDNVSLLGILVDGRPTVSISLLSAPGRAWPPLEPATPVLSKPRVQLSS